jgi:hypothetical protein
MATHTTNASDEIIQEVRFFRVNSGACSILCLLQVSILVFQYKPAQRR